MCLFLKATDKRCISDQSRGSRRRMCRREPRLAVLERTAAGRVRAWRDCARDLAEMRSVSSRERLRCYSRNLRLPLGCLSAGSRLALGCISRPAPMRRAASRKMSGAGLPVQTQSRRLSSTSRPSPLLSKACPPPPRVTSCHLVPSRVISRLPPPPPRTPRSPASS